MACPTSDGGWPRTGVSPAMNCREYERTWHEWLDARGGAPAGSARARARAEHEAACAACRAKGGGYRALIRAIGAIGPAPAVPRGFAGRFAPGGDLAVAAGPRLRRRPGGWGYAAAAAAATALVAGLVAVRGGRVDRAGPAVAAGRRPLTAALAEATSASWELARVASAPAARVGRDALGGAADLEIPTLAVGTAAGPDAPRALRAVGGGVQAGVGPLSGSARHAFGFLLAPLIGPDGPGPGASEPGRRRG